MSRSFSPESCLTNHLLIPSANVLPVKRCPWAISCSRNRSILDLTPESRHTRYLWQGSRR
ncbi:hypothetical protein SCLCIDRAFT_760787 [Scleroderma citrinum Foug A]|uniref:Uncharacterized protein n=1 Tax=Scleroderma citrinum Foug A TaxID=1036808 RepID=A0A0C2ZNT7_9AGAM|nr:hypothetical protein SCLCIDRAFT_760787 [Scleroderma citrinum Foug A]